MVAGKDSSERACFKKNGSFKSFSQVDFSLDLSSNKQLRVLYKNRKKKREGNIKQN